MLNMYMHVYMDIYIIIIYVYVYNTSQNACSFDQFWTIYDL